MTSRVVTDEKTVAGYGTITVYEPFIMGGDVWQLRKFPIVGTLKTVDSDIKCILTKLKDEYRLYEQTSGGLLGHGKTAAIAIDCANNNISVTPNIQKQIHALAVRLAGLPEITLEKALSYRTS